MKRFMKTLKITKMKAKIAIKPVMIVKMKVIKKNKNF
jgi:hypothetical protein